MRARPGKCALSLFLALALCLGLLPMTAPAGSQDWLEAAWYDNNRMESYGFGANDGSLATDASGGIRFSVSAFVSVPEDCAIQGVYMADAATLAERYDLLDPAYGAECDNSVDSYENPDTGATEHSVSIWMQNIVIPNAVLGEYRLKVVTSRETYYSEAYSDAYYSTTGVVQVADGSALAVKPVIKTSSLPMVTLGNAYSAALEAEPHAEGAAITWSLTDGALPEGLTLSADGTVSGIPTAAGSFRFTVQAAEAGGETAERTLYLHVIYPAPTITTASLPDGRVGLAYTAHLEAEPFQSGGELTWSLSSGALPEGLTLSADGLISGTPTAAGSFRFVPMVTETATDVGAGRSFTLQISEETCRISFNLCGGAAPAGVSYDALSAAVGTSITLPDAPTRLGYSFGGWLCGGETWEPGADYTVSGDVRFSARWAELPDVSVTFPADAGPVVGSLWLVGTYGYDQSEILWDQYYAAAAMPDDITIPQWYFYNRSYTRLELCAYVDGLGRVIAEYDGDVACDSGTVPLTLSPGVSFAAVTGLQVEGLRSGSDYSSAYVCTDTGRGVSFPCLISSADVYRVSLFGNSSAPAYPVYDWEERYTPVLSDGMLTVTPRQIADPSVTVTGTVTLGGAPVSGASVQASQYYKGMNRTQTDVTDAAGNYSICVYPAARVYFSVLSHGAQVGGTTSLSDPEGAEIRHDIALTTARLQVELGLSAASDEKLVSRYLSRLRALDLTVTHDGKKDSYALGANEACRSITLYNTAAASGTLTCSLRGESIAETMQTTELFGGAAEVKLTPVLNPGVVVRLAAQVTGSYFLAWYDAGGAFAGASRSFTLSSDAGDVASVCPAAVKTGSFAVVLVSEAMRGVIGLTTLAGLAPEQAIMVWPVTLTEGAVAELDPYTVDTVTSRNALYATQPASTLYASAQGFGDESDLIVFTGSIGLDPGLTNGKLMTLMLDTRRIAYDHTSTATVQAIVIDGKRYEPYADWNVGLYGSYSVDLHQGISLPCDYAIYCRPGGIDMDMCLSITANGTYEGGLTGHGAFQDALVGSAVVSRPGAAIYTRSTYVCSDTITISGVARRGEAVSLYDNGTIVGTVQTDGGGRWTAQVRLLNADDSARSLATAHSLTAVSASGVESDPLTVVHQADGPELISFKMKWGGREINVGDAYTYAWGMQNTTFTAVFEHPEKLEVMPEWGEDVRAVFKVYTTDGEVRFLPAEGEGPEFSAVIDGVLRTSVSRAEVIFIPAKLNTGFDEDRGCFVLDDMAEELKDLAGEGLAAVNGHYGLTAEDALSAEKLTALLDGAAAEDGWSVSFGGETPELRGLEDADFSDFQDAMEAAGLTPESLSLRLGEDVRSTAEWLVAAGQRCSGTQAVRFESSNRVYRSEEDLQAAEDYVAGFAVKVAASEDGKAAVYVYSDLEPGEDGYDAEQSFLISFIYLHDNAGMPMERISAAFFPGFEAPEALLELSLPGTAADIARDFTDASHAGGLMASQSLHNTLQGTLFAAQGQYWPTPSPKPEPGQQDPAQGQVWPDLPSPSADTNQQSLAEAMGNPNSGDISAMTGIGATLVSKALESAALSWTSFVTGWYSVGEQLRNWADKKIQDGLNNFRMLRSILRSPCFRKLTLEDAGKITWTYSVYRFHQEYLDVLRKVDLLQTGYFTYLNSKILHYGTVTAPETGGGSMAAANALTVGITSFSWGFDKLLTFHIDQVENYDFVNYPKVQAKMDSIIRAHATETGDKDCSGKNSRDGNGQNFSVTNDPSGVVYEAVIENPVEGASVTLWYAVDTEGYPVREETAALAADLIPAAGMRDLVPREATQTTDENGLYQWGVPEGLWFVTAEYAGLTGDSEGDSAAVIDALERRLLPVLPPQLNVNIPLVDPSAPMVTDVRCTSQGIYVTFSKYMAESGALASVLDPANYSLTLAATGEEISIASVVSAEQGHAPSNIDPKETTYTRTVLLRTAEELAPGDEAELAVRSRVESYAGTPMKEDYTCGITCTSLSARLDGTGKGLLYQYAFPADGSTAYVIAAGYDARGRLLDTAVRQVSCEGVYSGTIAVPEGADGYKLFVLDSAHRPMTDPWTSDGA